MSTPKTELTVLCQLWGTWGAPMQGEYVRRLRDGVAEHLSAPHRFVCMTDIHEIVPDDIETIPLGCAGWRWNLRKMAMYDAEYGFTGRVLALDLDTIIVGSLDDIASYDGRFAVLEDFYEPGRCGGGIIGFEGGTLNDEIYAAVRDNQFAVNAMTRGSERKWYRHQMPDADFWQAMHPGQIVSYKPRPSVRLKEVPENARIVCFHGDPRPHECDAEWLQHYWR